MAKATPKQVQEFFNTPRRGKPTLTEMKEFKAVNGGKDYDAVAEGIGNGTLTY